MVYFIFCSNFQQDGQENLTHQSEAHILKEISKCAKIHQNVRRFVMQCSSTYLGNKCEENDDSDVARGLYYEALAQGLDAALGDFRERLISLEKKHITNPHLAINHFLTELKEYETFFHFLEQLLNELKTQKLFGCTILSLLHKYSFHTDAKTMQALKIIRRGVYAVFLRQLSQWLIYGRLVDVHEEFFIVHRDKSKKNSNTASDLITTSERTNVSKMETTNSNLWQYQISYTMIPSNFTVSWAEKVLFIGQTVRMLFDDPNKSAMKASIWNDEDERTVGNKTLWNKQSYMFLKKFQVMHNCDVGLFENLVNEIKVHVTERLSEIAFNQADLIKHLGLFKDYYLQGRGELFLEFIIQLKDVKVKNGVSENLDQEVNHAFQKALNRTSTDMDHITLHFLSDDNVDILDLENNLAFLKLIRLKFKVQWPLHLFFSPRVLNGYNKLFSYLLQIRHIQNELHLVWHLHREKKVDGSAVISQLRHKMLFLIDNLQYYLQVDVIESQYSTLLNTVQNSKDFEYIERAHSVFQANILSCSFLLNDSTGESANASDQSCLQSENPVLTILKKIFKIILSFCDLNINYDIESAESHQQLEVLDQM